MRKMLGRAFGTTRRLFRRSSVSTNHAHPAWDWHVGTGPRVLFVSSAQGAPFRYRVLNQAEQLTLQGVAHAYTPLATCREHHVQACDLVYLYRAHDLQATAPLFEWAKRWSRPVVYDTDDLTWDQRLVEYCFLDRHFARSEIISLQTLFAETWQIMQRVDAFVVSTPYLAGRIGEDFRQPIYVNENALSQELVAASADVLRRGPANSVGSVVLGYFSGWPKNHEEDFAVAMPALRRLFAERPELHLRIVGHLDPITVAGLTPERVEWLGFVPWTELPGQVAQVAINLAPLVDNPHRRSKSAIKVLEAALVAVPSVASAIDPYSWIENGRTGMLVHDETSWYTALSTLTGDAGLRHHLGTQARATALTSATTAARAAGFVATLTTIVEDAGLMRTGEKPPKILRQR